jgi:hypothetical protein
MYAYIYDPDHPDYQVYGPDTREKCEEWINTVLDGIYDHGIDTSTVPRNIVANRIGRLMVKPRKERPGEKQDGTEICRTILHGKETDNYRLIGIEVGGYIDLPGNGDRETSRAARRARRILNKGGTYEEAVKAAWTQPRQ